MENRKFMSLNDYIEEFNKSGEKDFYAFLDKNKKQALENGDEELADYIEAISSQAYEEQKEYDEYMQEEYEREEKRKQKEAEYQDYDGEELLDSESKELENNNNEEESIEKTEEDIRNSIIKKVQNLIEHFEEQSMSEVKLSEEEHSMFIKMIANNPQLNGKYIMDTYRREYGDESYYHDATAEEQEEMDKTNGNDYLSIKIGENLYLNEDFNRYRRISSIKIENDRLHGDTEKKYGEEEFYIDEIITPEDLIEGMHDKAKELSSLSVEELQEIVNGNDEQISLNDEEIKQALIQRIVEQQQTIARRD